MERYKLKDFAKWALREEVSDAQLLKVISEMSRGLLGDRLGACIYKKRIKIGGRGKRGGGRAIILFKTKDVALFLYGYSKNEQDNISHNEEVQLRVFANEFMTLSLQERTRLKAQGKLISIED